MAAQPVNRKTFPAVTRKRDWQAVRAGDKVSQILGSMPKEMAGALAGARIRERFARAVVEEYGPNAAAFILGNIQGVYLVKDDAPRKASATGPAPVYLNIYTTESIIKADLDANQEALKRRLYPLGVRFDRLKPISSTGDMRYKAPFAGKVAELRAQIARQAAALNPEAQSGKTQVSAESGAALTPEERKRVEESLAAMDNPRLADAIRRAMSAAGAD